MGDQSWSLSRDQAAELKSLVQVAEKVQAGAGSDTKNELASIMQA